MPTDEQKAKILEHIYYEILRCFVFEQGEERYTEFWIPHMVHARVLLEFFESAKERKDDVVCTHFGFAARDISLDDEHRTRFNKDVHHLTYARLRHTSATKGWDIRSALIPLAERTLLFMDHIIISPPTGAPPSEIERWTTLRNVLKTALPPNNQYGSSGLGL